MAVYNAQAYLNEAIDSVLKQQYENWELICVDDGSSDLSLNILKKYSEIDKRIKVISSVHSGKASAARNKALPVVTGDYTCILDSDDKLEPNTLLELVSVISTADADFIVFSTKFCDANCNSVIGELLGYHGRFDKVLTGMNAFVESLQWKISGLGAIKSEIVQRLKWNEVGMNGDELSTRLFFLESKIVAFTKGAYLYRKHPESTTTKISTKKFFTLDTNLSLINLMFIYNIDEKIRFTEIKRHANLVRWQYKQLIKYKNSFSREEFDELKRYIKGHFFKMLNLEITSNKGVVKKQFEWTCLKIKTAMDQIFSKNTIKTQAKSIY